MDVAERGDEVGDVLVELGIAGAIAGEPRHSARQQRGGQLGERHLRARAEVRDHLGRAERSEPPARREVDARA